MTETREVRLTRIEEAIREVEKEVKNPKKILDMLQKIEQSNKDLKNKFEEISNELKLVKEKQIEQDKIISTLMAENRTINAELAEMNEYIEIQQREKRRNWVEITGVPIRENENNIQTLEKIHQVCQLPFKNDDIKEIYRKKERKNVAAIVVKFVNTENRDKLQKMIRMKRLKTGDLEQNFEGNAIFANDCLSRKAGRLFWLARRAKFEQKWKDVWVSRSKIFVRRNEEDEAIYIKSENELKTLLK